jgi:hypothetical protein
LDISGDWIPNVKGTGVSTQLIAKVADQQGRIKFQCFCNLEDVQQADIALAALDRTDLGPMQA